MSEELRNLLAEYLGELSYKLENAFDWIESDAIKEKINAVEILLDCKKTDFKITLDKIKEIIKA